MFYGFWSFPLRVLVVGGVGWGAFGVWFSGLICRFGLLLVGVLVFWLGAWFAGFVRVGIIRFWLGLVSVCYVLRWFCWDDLWLGGFGFLVLLVFLVLMFCVGMWGLPFFGLWCVRFSSLVCRFGLVLFVALHVF